MRLKPFLVGAAVIVVGYLLKGPAPFLTRPPRLPDGSAIRVQVLNGSDVAKAGLGLAQELRRKGFDVVEIGNAPARHDSTLVIDRIGESKWAAAVAKRMGVRETVRERNPELLVEVTVILGADRASNYGREP